MNQGCGHRFDEPDTRGRAVGCFDEVELRCRAVGCFDEAGVRGGAKGWFDDTAIRCGAIGWFDGSVETQMMDPGGLGFFAPEDAVTSGNYSCYVYRQRF